MKRLVVVLAAVLGLVMAMGADVACAQGRGGGHSGGGGGYSGGGGGHSRGGGGYSHGSGGHGGYHGGHYGGHYGGYYGYRGWYGGAYLGLGYWGWPWYAGAYPYYPYYPNGGYPVYESAPSIYVEPMQPQGPSAQQPPAPPNLWYYCTDPAGYHPYVQNCNVPWVKVLPPPPSPAMPSGSIAPGPARPVWQTATSGQPAK